MHDELSKLPLPRLNNVTAEIVLSDFYRTKFGIFDHLHGNIALASCLLHEKEKTNYEDKLEILFRNYVNKQIGDIFKLSLLEYLDLPSYVTAIMNKICDDELKKKSTILSNIESQMQGTK